MLGTIIITIFLVNSLCIALSYTASAYTEPHFVGNRSVIVQLMEWKYEEIAKECELFLGPYGYGGVQTSPVAENAHYYENGQIRAYSWSDKYTPVSYDIVTHSGNEQQFRDMVERCNKVSVRVYVDIVMNHMTAQLKGNGTNNHAYDGVAENYPGVPFTSVDFHGHESCPTADLDIRDYGNPSETRNCQLGGMRDIDQSKEWVRKIQSDFLNKLIDIGVAGFRSDASFCQWPTDLENIYSRLHSLNTKYFAPNLKPFIYHEVIDSRFVGDYIGKVGRVIEFRYYQKMGHVFRKLDNSFLKDLNKSWDKMATDDAVVMIDSHDLQRGHNGDLNINIRYFQSKLLRMSTVFMLAWDYGITKIMSSYLWDQKVVNNHDENDWVGPPMDSNGNILGVQRNSDLSCGKEWICEHRWRQIFNMVSFRNVVGNEKVTNWWDNGSNSIAFSRGNKGFVAINNDNQPINQKLNTGLPAGRYCDLMSGNLIRGECSGKEITVNNDGTAQVLVDNKWDDPMIAIHINTKI